MKNLRLLATGLVALGLAQALGAANTPAPSNPTPPPTSNYTNTWEQSRTETYTSFGGSGFGNYYGGSYTSAFGGNWYRPTTISVSYRVLNIMFPPDPVILGQTLPKPPMGVRSSNSTLAQMRPYLSENFYPALSAFIHDESLSTKRLEKITSYRGAKQKLITELRNELNAIHQADPAARPAMYQALAARQEPQIAELEKSADEIRKDLVGGSWFSSSVDWNDTRSWRLGDNTRYESYMDEYLVMRASAFFQNGLSTEQRPLLRELAMELIKRGQDPTADIALDSSGPYVFFSPFTARIRLPMDMPAGLNEKINRYRDLKDSLKQELRNTIYKQDRAWLDSTRTNALKELAAKQAPQIAELENLAEEIRVGLADCKYPDEPPKSLLPADLAVEVSAYLQAKVELQSSLMTRLYEVRSLLPKDRVEIVRMGGGYGIQIVGMRKSSDAVTARREELRTQLDTFNKEQITRFEVLASQKEKLRLRVDEISKKGSDGARTIDRLLAEFSRSFAQQELWNKYKEYRTAVLEPGLSPGQRRLLYSASLETLMNEYMN